MSFALLAVLVVVVALVVIFAILLGREFAKVSVANYHRAPGPSSSSSCPYSPSCLEVWNSPKFAPGFSSWHHAYDGKGNPLRVGKREQRG